MVHKDMLRQAATLVIVALATGTAAFIAGWTHGPGPYRFVHQQVSPNVIPHCENQQEAQTMPMTAHTLCCAFHQFAQSVHTPSRCLLAIAALGLGGLAVHAFLSGAVLVSPGAQISAPPPVAQVAVSASPPDGSSLEASAPRASVSTEGCSCEPLPLTPAETTAVTPRDALQGAVDSPFVPLLAQDGTGTLHLFWWPGLHFRKDTGDPGAIAHRIRTGAEWVPRPSVEPRKMPIEYARAASGSGGTLILLWTEEEWYSPPFSGQDIYLSTWGAEGWSPPEAVTDPRASPGVLGWQDLDLVAGPGGTLDVFWLDWREESWLRNLIRGESDVSKVFHRRRTGAHWTPATKVQGRDQFLVSYLSPVLDGTAQLHLFWGEDKCRSDSSGVCGASYENGHWSKKACVRYGSDPSGYPGGATFVTAAARPGDALLLASGWRAWAGQGPTEALEFRQRQGGRWSDTAVVSRRASHAEWVGRQAETKGLLFQEYPDGDRQLEKQMGQRLYFACFDGKGLKPKELVAEGTVMLLFDAALDPDGVLHIVYVDTGPEGVARLMYRRAALPAVCARQGE